MADDGSVVRAKTYFSSPDEGDDKQIKARRLVQQYRKDVGIEDGEGETLTIDDIYVVMFAYVLGSWKAHVSTTVPDGRYFEVTYNRDKDETYVDEYKKQNNVVYKSDGA